MRASTLTEKIFAVAVIVVFFAAVFVRVYNLQFNSLYLDEADVIQNSTGTLSQVFHKTFRMHTTWPLYNMALNLWMRIFGSTEFSTRMLSAVCGIFTVILLFYISSLRGGILSGIISGGLLAASVYHAEYSKLVGRYVMAGLLCLLSTWFFFRFCENHRYWWQYLILTGLFLLSHVFALPIVGAHVLYFYFYRRRNIKVHLIMAAFIAGFAAVFIPVLMQRIVFFRQIEWMTDFSMQSFVEVNFSPALYYDSQKGYIVAWILFAVFVSACINSIARQHHSFENIALFCWVICTGAVFIMSAFVVKCYHPKNFLMILPFFCHVIGFYLARSRRRIFLAVLVLLFVLYNSGHIYSRSFDYKNIPWREIVSEYLRLDKAGKCFYYHNSIDGSEWITIQYYLKEKRQIYPVFSELNAALIPDDKPVIVIRETGYYDFIKLMEKCGFELKKKILYNQFTAIYLLAFEKKSRETGKER